jgi:hypothetical protein
MPVKPLTVPRSPPTNRPPNNPRNLCTTVSESPWERLNITTALVGPILYSFGCLGAGGVGAFAGAGLSAFARFCELVPLCSRAARRLLLLRLSPITRMPLNGSLTIRPNSVTWRELIRDRAGYCTLLAPRSRFAVIRVSKIQNYATNANHLRSNYLGLSTLKHCNGSSHPTVQTGLWAQIT